nr:MAG TPA: hypothetical protein [Caudoviricetes sp.]
MGTESGRRQGIYIPRAGRGRGVRANRTGGMRGQEPGKETRAGPGRSRKWQI